MAKKSKGKLPGWIKYLISVIFLVVLIIVIYQNKKYVHRVVRYLSHRYIKTEVSPSDYPLGYSVHGIDISHYQPDVDWEKLKAINQLGDTVRFQFVFIKATEGLLLEDVMFDEHWEDAKKNKVIRGAYHYFLPDRSAKLQATNFITSVKLQKGDLPPVVDVEETMGKTKEQLVVALKVFLSEIREHYHVQPIIYSNLNFIEDYLADDFKSYPFWMAHYYHDDLTPIDSINLVFWQHSDKADLLGINGNADVDVFTRTKEEFRKLLIR